MLAPLRLMQHLLLREHFLADAAAELRRIAAETHEIVAVVGFPERAADVYNSAAVLAGGAVHAIYRKVYLPNYGVFDEQRYFQAGTGGATIDLGDRRFKPGWTFDTYLDPVASWMPVCCLTARGRSAL